MRVRREILPLALVLAAPLFGQSSATQAAGESRTTPAGAAVQVSTTATAAGTTSPAAAGGPSAILRVVGVSCADRGVTRENEPCRLGDILKVRVENLEAWKAGANPPRDPGKLILYLNGRALQKSYAARPAIDGSGSADTAKDLRFELRRVADEPDNQAAWNTVLRRTNLFTARTVTAGVGLESDSIVYGDAEMKLIVASPRTVSVAIIGFFILLGLFLWLARASDIVRDADIAPLPGQRRTFSLARCQMAWWFFLVAGSYVYLWIVTAQLVSLTSGVLVLIGISAATGLSSMIVDQSHLSEDDRRRIPLEREVKGLQRDAHKLTRLAAAPGLSAEAQRFLEDERTQKKARLDDIAKTLASLAPAIRPISKGLIDILRDNGDSVSFHRFQIATWTLILGFVFIQRVYTDLSMPDFDATLLGLMGISSGTYLGFKLPGSQTPAQH